jgi:hypothetical protein
MITLLSLAGSEPTHTRPLITGISFLTSRTRRSYTHLAVHDNGERFSSVVLRIGMRSAPALPKLRHFSAHFWRCSSVGGILIVRRQMLRDWNAIAILTCEGRTIYRTFQLHPKRSLSSLRSQVRVEGQMTLSRLAKAASCSFHRIWSTDWFMRKEEEI